MDTAAAEFEANADDAVFLDNIRRNLLHRLIADAIVMTSRKTSFTAEDILKNQVDALVELMAIEAGDMEGSIFAGVYEKLRLSAVQTCVSYIASGIEDADQSGHIH